MKRILFVDDDSNVLNGLQRGLRSMKGEWQMDFATGGKDALQAINSVAPHALVTDVRMPGIDGFQLLNMASRNCPQVIRIVLAQSLVPVGTGLLVGLVGSAALGRFVEGLLFEVSPLDPLMLGGGVLLLALVAGAACAVPAGRAARIDPVTALRGE